MRTIPEVAEDIKNILNEAERKQECDGETLVDIDELVNEILTINCYKDKPMTNSERIRAMSDEELAEFLYGVDHFVDDGQCIVCFEEIRLNDDKADILDWLQSEVKGSDV